MQPAPASRLNFSPRFRLRWRGYDRAEVDEFLRRTAADRRQLQEDLAQLETIMRARVGQRSSPPAPAPAAVVAPVVEPREASEHREPGEARAEQPSTAPQPTPKAPRYGLIGTVSVLVLASLVAITQFALRGRSISAADATSPASSAAHVAEESSVQPAAAPVDGINITLTARATCWVRTSVDGQEPIERLLRPNDTILLRAKDAAVLRVGDAGALGMLINSRPAKPLGAAGQVVTTRITRTNYSTFLSGN
jgi:DivIVA domain-containing protein